MTISNTYEIFNITNVGKVRTNNEDSYASFRNETYILQVLCDGMGGMEGGEIASKLAIDAIGEEFQAGFEAPAVFFQSAIRKANDKIMKYAKTHPELNKMGTTVVMLLFDGQFAYYAHVGDSRLYLLRNSELTQLTRDHSYVNEMVDRGMIDEVDAKNHQYKNRITKCVGLLNSDPEISQKPIETKNGDIFILCSDGLTDLVDDTKIKKILLHFSELHDMGEALVNQALNAGGHDNITIQLLRVKKPDQQTFKKSVWRRSNILSSFLVFLSLIILILIILFYYKKNKISVKNESNLQKQFLTLSAKSVSPSILTSEKWWSFQYPAGKEFLLLKGDSIIKRIISKGPPQIPHQTDKNLNAFLAKCEHFSFYPSATEGKIVKLVLGNSADLHLPDSLKFIKTIYPPPGSVLAPTDTIIILCE